MVSMDPQRWQRLESVFFEALERAPAERAAFLDAACEGDGIFRAEVEAVLAAHDDGADRDDAMAGDEAANPANAMIGARIGPYRLETLIGRGGMGEVYRATRVDEQYHQEVAVKLVRPGLATREVIRRFRVERQILANLQHPNIATLLEGGVTPDGQPYLVMQYVRGATITAYADERGLSTVDRLQLFRIVCDAVQYAHANLVVHRDLKPSNILVTDDGQVRLLDFGIAKLLDPGTSPGDDALTGDTLAFTPEHAAPEQLRREPVTTATDVYSLGVLLYELLTGVPPFRSPSPAELYHAVCDLAPVRPSVAAAGSPRESVDVSEPPASSGRPLRRSRRANRLPVDLDHIVLMALRKEPERRYASAGQFAEDVARFLQGLPVMARPDSVGYRVRRFVGRNRTAVALAALAFISLFTGLLGTTMQARQTRIEAATAAAERDRAEHVSSLLVDVFRLSDPGSTRGQTVTAREVLGQGAARIAQDLADQPEAQGDLLAEVGRIYQNLGLFDEADVHLSRSLDLRRSVHGERHPRVAQTLILMSSLRVNQGQAAEAIEFATDASAMLRDASPRQPHPLLPDALIAMGLALRTGNEPARAAEAYAEAAWQLEAVSSTGDARIAQAYFGWADAAHGQGRFDLADSLLEETITSFRQLGVTVHPDLATSMFDLAVLRTHRRRAAEAEPLLRESLDMRRAIYGDTHPAVGQVLTALAHALSLLGQYAEADDIAAAAVATADSAWGRNHDAAAQARLARGFILFKLDRGEQAVAILRDAGAILRAQPGASPARLVGVDIMIAQAYASMGRYDLAWSQYEAALGRVEKELGPDHAYRAHLLIELASLDLDAGRPAEAERRARESLALTERTLRADHRFALWATLVLAQVETTRGRLDAADSMFRRVLETQRATVGEDHPETAMTLARLADVETRLGRYDDAVAHARAAVDVLESSRETGPILPTARSILGGALAGQRRREEAEPLLREALRQLEGARGARRRDVDAAAERVNRWLDG
jgi:serine/threonine-protein kinase